MNRLLISATLTLTLALAGCASGPAGRSGTASAAAPAAAPAPEAPRLAPAVAIPAAARQRVVLAMTGGKNVTEARDWADFRREWRETFADHAKDAGIAYRFAEDAPQPGAEDGTLILVEVADYRMVGIGARLFFGAMTGNAYIDANVRYSSLRDGTVFGQQPYQTASTAWGGVFARMTPQQVDAIAANVFRDLAAPRP